MNTRRRILLALGAGALAAPSALFAQPQPAPGVHRIGFLAARSRSTPADPDFYYDAFVEGMRELGYIEGKNLIIEWRFADGNYKRLDAIAAELEGRSLREIEEIADGRVTPVTPSGSGRESGSASGRESGSGREGAGAGRGSVGDEARAEIARQASRLYRRIALFPGVELTVAEDAPDESVRLVKEMLAILEAMSRDKGREGGGRKR